MPLGTYNGFPPAQRARVQRWVATQWNSGALPRPSCCVACGQTEGRIDGHHEDYDDPTGYVDLCLTCHTVLHARFRQVALYRYYCERIRRGWTAPPADKLAQVSSTILAGRWPDGTRGPDRGPGYLDTLTLTRAPQAA